MHPYAIDVNQRRSITIFLIVLAVLLQGGVARVPQFTELFPTVAKELIFDPASTGAILAVLLAWFDRWGWRLVPRIYSGGIPDLNGVWDGCGHSSFGGEAGTPFPAKITIRQTWTSIVIELSTGQSASASDSASLFLNKRSNPILVYTYMNTPSLRGKRSMHAHAGTAELDLLSARDSTTLSGSYYSGRGRKNFGTLRVSQARKRGWLSIARPSGCQAGTPPRC